jgi:hypothetical protein
MPTPIEDFIPSAPASNSPAGAAAQKPAASRRGGRRPGAGAPKGNLNAFKHGRHSRFKELLPSPQPVAAGAARRLITREQRIAERHAANLLALARLARYRADCAAAVDEGRPLPPPPLITYRDVDLTAIEHLLTGIAEHVLRERSRAAGLLTSESESIARDREFARSVEQALPLAIAALDRSATASLAPAAVTALLDAVGGNKPDNDQSQPLPTEAAPAELSTAPDSEKDPGEKTASIKRRERNHT